MNSDMNSKKDKIINAILIIITIVIVILLLSACSSNNNENNNSGLENEPTVTRLERGLWRHHDDELNVTCWGSGMRDGGVFCIPDWQLQPPQE